MNISPISLFVYNRPEHTHKTIEALQKNFLAKDSDLFIYCDGPRNEELKTKVSQVRDYVKNISGFKSLNIIEREVNMGLANSIISGATEITNKFGRAIILEDDILTSPYFLQYMNDALNLYENEEKVVSISSYMYPIEKVMQNKLPDTFFLKLTSSWGWATWERSWKLFEPDGKKLLAELENNKLTKEFDINGSYGYANMLKRQIAGLNNSWAIRWYASSFLRNKLTLYPKRSLVQNIGFDGTGTHSSKSDQFAINLNNERVGIAPIPMEESELASKALTNYFNSRKPTLLERIERKVRKIF